jgi:hypothetical protein
MGIDTQRPAGVPARVVLLAAIGYGGLAMCLTLLFLGMRVVMDVGGTCGEGGPYVWDAPPCPDAAFPATFGGIFGLFAFGAIASVYGLKIGGAWAVAPLLGWVALFGSLGWNFVDYGLVNPPEETGVEVGLVICGVLFWIMAFGPLLLVLPLRQRGSGAIDAARYGTVVRIGSAADAGRPVQEPSAAARPVGEALGRGISIMPAASLSSAERRELAGIASAFGAAVARAEAGTAANPEARAALELASDEGEAFTEGTQALLDRLERLADMRDRGLLTVEEFDAAKVTIIAELENRS